MEKDQKQYTCKMDKKLTYVELRPDEKLALRNALLNEYLHLGVDLDNELKADLDLMVAGENYESAAMYRDLLNDLDELDELAK